MIHDAAKMAQAKDFSSITLPKRIRPSDLDGVIDLFGKGWVIFELKYGDATVPVGQRIMLENMAKDFETARKPCMVILASHGASDASQAIDVGRAKVTGVYWHGAWRKPPYAVTLNEMIQTMMGEVE